MRDNKAVATLAGLAIVASVAGLLFSVSGGFGPRLEPGPFREAGRVLAQQSLAQLKPGGTLTVLTRDTAAFQNPASDVLFGSFQRELKKHGAKVDSTQLIEVDPLRPMSVPAGDFAQWIKKGSKGSVIVSLMGPPMLNETQLASLGEVNPAIIALCSGPVRTQVDLRALFAQGLLRAAIVTRDSASAQKTAPANDRDAFDRQFIAVTADNLAALAASSSTQ
jgi:hypothetical protein